MEILVERPEWMDFVDYKIHMRIQNRLLKQYLKGRLYYKASEIHYSPEDKEHLFGIKETFSPYVGKVSDLTTPI